MAKAGVQFSTRDEWYTPKELVDYFEPFDYDPATTPAQAKLLGISNYDTIDTDGLKADWSSYNRIFINPPFTKKFEFLEKAVNTDSHIFFLIPLDSLATRKFAKIMKGKGYILYLPNGRIKFSGATSPAFGTVILEMAEWIKDRKIEELDLDELRRTG